MFNAKQDPSSLKAIILRIKNLRIVFYLYLVMYILHQLILYYSASLEAVRTSGLWFLPAVNIKFNLTLIENFKEGKSYSFDPTTIQPACDVEENHDKYADPLSFIGSSTFIRKTQYVNKQVDEWKYDDSVSQIIYYVDSSSVNTPVLTNFTLLATQTQVSIVYGGFVPSEPPPKIFEPPPYCAHKNAGGETAIFRSQTNDKSSRANHHLVSAALSRALQK